MSYFEKKGIIEKKRKTLVPKKIIQSEIISCSRRTDIPAFLMDWVINRIKQGFVDVVNPFNRKIVSRVSLNSNDVKVWVWWSKDFRSWINKYKENPEIFKQYKGHFFNFTINSPSALEEGVKISLEKRLEQLEWLVNTFGPERIQYRFDPIVFYRNVEDGEEGEEKKEKEEGEEGKKGLIDNLDKFEFIISKVSSLGIKEIIFSFATIYTKVKKRMKYRGKIIVDLPINRKKKVLDNLIGICDSYGISMHACCQPELIGYKNAIKQAHCINGEKIKRLNKGSISIVKDKGQRDSCGCSKSRDIGGYNGIFRCKHNCDYCYANPVKK
ncbi:MAG: DUF1848 family protein [Promethearchaeota archaeon]